RVKRHMFVYGKRIPGQYHSDRIECLGKERPPPDKQQVTGGYIYCGSLSIEQPPRFGSIEIADVSTASFRAARCVVEEVTPVGEELRQTVTYMTGRVRAGHVHTRIPGQLSSSCGDSADRTEQRRRIEYRVIVVPRAAASARHRQYSDRPAVNIDPLELVVCKESDRGAIRRPERTRRAVGPF